MSDEIDTLATRKGKDKGPNAMPELASSHLYMAWEAAEPSAAARFEGMVRLYPDRPAIKDAAEALTYDELNRAANRLARAMLAEAGGGQEPIALLLEHGVATIVAIVAVLKTGTIYVPLAPGQPPGRLDAIMGDAEAKLLVTNHKNLAAAHGLAQQKGYRVLNLDEIDAGIADDDLGLHIPPETFLNITYTSGSTGQPKGVIQTHRGMLHAAWVKTQCLHLGPEDRIALLVSSSASASSVYICSALINGAALVLFDLKRAGIPALADWLIDEEITVYHSVPTVFRHLLATLCHEHNFPRLRAIELGGEQVFKRDLALYKQHFADSCIFRTGFGATETHLLCHYFLDKTSEIAGEVVPVGYPLDGTELLLLDDNGTPVTNGEVGEIVAKSRYLSPGYWKKPDLTKAAFQAAPDGGDERVYRTGDLGRILPDGSLEHLGRKDQQVKIRGYRVEVGEVEGRLLDIEGVAEAAVVARRDHQGETRLVGYVVPSDVAPPAASALRQILAAQLPDYMIPSAFVVLEKLPLLPFGKIDRAALPTPDWGRPILDRVYEAPRTPMEELLAGIWSEVLGVQQVSIHDNFFDLGGNSLHAAQVVARANTACQVDLPLSTLFDAPTVVGQALMIVQILAENVQEDEMARLLAEIEAAPEYEVEAGRGGT